MNAPPAFRRAILLRSGDGAVTAELEDDFHRFGVTLRHDGRVVTGVAARAGRYPWATCAEAPAALEALAGVTLAPNPALLFRQADAQAHCTHLFELAALAIGQAARGDGERRLEAEVADPVAGGGPARLFEDGELVLAWTLQEELIVAPEAYAGRRAKDFNSRALAELEPQLAERLLILRRAVQTAMGRRMDIDGLATAAEMGRPAACYSLQPENAGRARRLIGSVRDWPDRPSLMRSLRS